jgi:primosomal protein N' (replication factor Y) (superfamily II helicase)
VILRASSDDLAQAEARRIAALLRDAAETIAPEVRLVGPAPCPILKLRGYYRYHFRMQSADIEPLQRVWRAVRPNLEPAPDVELTIDVDPLDMR